MLQEIVLENDTFEMYSCSSNYENCDFIIDELKKINILIGANNSGKSRLLRKLFSKNNYSYIHKNINKEEFLVQLDFALYDIKEHLRKVIRYNPEPLNLRFERLKNYLYKNINDSNFNSVINDINNAFEFDQSFYLDSFPTILSHRSEFEFNQHAQKVKARYLSKHIESIEKINNTNLPPCRYYIPILRSLKGLSPKTEEGIHSFDDLYKSHTVKEYFQGEGNNLNIFTGLSLYEDVTKLLLGDISERNKIRDFENFLSESFFGKEVNIVPRIKTKTLHIKIGEEEKAIHELGDGVQSIIILTYPLFIHQGENAIFFFEEPETHLHPGFQRLFIETLEREEFKNFQYFITTHSNHFLDITLENDNMSIYTFVKEENTEDPDNPTFHVNNIAAGDDNILRLIGANKSSVFLSNCTIWVEGITDRIYLRKYLDLYQKELKNNAKLYKEDYHYSFVEYAGSNITHWSFLDDEDSNNPNINVDRLCAISYAITDSDNAGDNKDGTPSKKKQRLENLNTRLSEERYYCIEGKEIENTLTNNIVIDIIKSYEPDNKDLHFENFETLNIKKEGLGKLIIENITGLKKDYKADSGTIKGSLKTQFAKKATEQMKNFNDLSVEAKHIAERLYTFIHKQNS